MLKLFLFVVLAYLIGSIPTAYLTGIIKRGTDIRKEGTGNMGTTNTLILMGPISALLVYIVDLFKGIIPVLLAKNYVGTDVSMGLCGFAAIFGHDYPVYVGFKGGKGVATTTGAMFGINAVIMSMILPLWVVLVFLTDYFILASLLCMLAMPILMFLFGLSVPFILTGVAFFALGLFTHWQDVVNIYKGKGKRAISSAKKFLNKNK